MPLHVVRLLVEALGEAGVNVASVKVAVLGYAYLENSDDMRNSPSKVVVSRLRELGAEVAIHDLWVRGYRGDLQEVVQGSDAVILMVAHDAYRTMDLGGLRDALRTPIVIDGRGIFGTVRGQEAGFVYLGVGEGKQQM